ncbi:redox-sensing transcriptional repressor Rex [Desulfothermus okinawensis]
MLKKERIPKVTIHRMAVYLQVLEELHRDGEEVISSSKLAELCGVNSSQIRKDLAYFGEFGVRGVGYFIKDLIASINHFLGLGKVWNCAIVGMGNLGRAILRHKGLPERGFRIVGAFDCDPFKIGEKVGDLEIICTRRLKERARELNIEIGIITTPPNRAQRAANHIVEAGIKAIVNFAPTRISVPEDVIVDYVDFSTHLIYLSFNLSRTKKNI